MLHTTSEIATWRRCPMEHHIKYVELRRTRTALSSLGFGRLVHGLLENEGRAALGLPALPLDGPVDAFDLAKARAMMLGYKARWEKPLDFLAVEHEWRAGGFAGKMDGIARHHGRVVLVEYKTTSEDIAMGSDYWMRVSTLDEQVTRYLWALRGTPWETDTCLYDVLRKPDIRGKKSETADEFFARCCGVIAAAPEKFYRRAEIVRTSDQIDAFEEEQSQTLEMMDHASSRGMHPKNPGGCKRYNRDCEYLPVCCGETSLANDLKYRTADRPHEELGA